MFSAVYTDEYFLNDTFLSLFSRITAATVRKTSTANQFIAAVKEPFQRRFMNFGKSLKAALCLQTEEKIGLPSTRFQNGNVAFCQSAGTASGITTPSQTEETRLDKTCTTRW